MRGLSPLCCRVQNCGKVHKPHQTASLFICFQMDVAVCEFVFQFLRSLIIDFLELFNKRLTLLGLVMTLCDVPEFASLAILLRKFLKCSLQNTLIAVALPSAVPVRAFRGLVTVGTPRRVAESVSRVCRPTIESECFAVRHFDVEIFLSVAFCCHVSPPCFV